MPKLALTLHTWYLASAKFMFYVWVCVGLGDVNALDIINKIKRVSTLFVGLKDQDLGA